VPSSAFIAAEQSSFPAAVAALRFIQEQWMNAIPHHFVAEDLATM
jgi:hypothetical protein